LHEFVEITIEHRAGVRGRHASAQVLHHLIGLQDVRADLVIPADIGLGFLSSLRSGRKACGKLDCRNDAVLASAPYVCFWHLADNPAVPVFVAYWTRADNGGIWPAMVCQFLTQTGHGASGWVSVSKAAVCLAGAIWEAFSLVLAAALPEPLARLRRR
jgi:hypothetical protein